MVFQKFQAVILVLYWGSNHLLLSYESSSYG